MLRARSESFKAATWIVNSSEAEAGAATALRLLRPGAVAGGAGLEAAGVPGAFVPRPGVLVPTRGGKTFRTSGRFSTTTRYVRSFCGCSRVIETSRSVQI